MSEFADVSLTTATEVGDFQRTVWTYYDRHRRDMPWRQRHEPYDVLVSELMLQQTQVKRVIPKFQQFMRLFPTIDALAVAPLADVLKAWSGLGYNRRAKFLHQTARTVVADHGGVLPDDLEGLMGLPGIGRNTAGAILAYAFNRPVIFIETNIRSVLIFHFYPAAEKVRESQLATAAELVLDRDNPREWHWALMDYGAHIKKTHGSGLGRVAAYRKQTPLKGSVREMRGMILRQLVEHEVALAELAASRGMDERLEPALRSLEKDGLITLEVGVIRLTDAKELLIIGDNE